MKEQNSSKFIMQTSHYKLWDDRLVIIQDMDESMASHSDHYRLEGKLHR